MTHIFKTLTLTAVALAASVAAHAQSFPAANKPITIVVPFAAGGPTDRVARDLAQALRKPLNNATIVINNVSGAGGTLGVAKVARAKNDGYTILLHHIGMSTIPALYRKAPFSVTNDFEYLGMVNEVPMTLIGRPTHPATTYKDLAAWIGQNKANVNLGHAGIGSASHLCGLMFQDALNIKMTAVPYKGTAPALTDLLAGNIDIMCDQTTNTTVHIEAKSVKAYAVTSPKRLNTPALKDLPTLQDQGLKDFNVTVWHGLYAPKGTPADVIKTLNDALKVALKNPDFIARQNALGAVVINDKRVEPAEHKTFVQSEINKWGSVIKAAGEFVE